MALEDGPETVKSPRFEAIATPNARGWYWRNILAFGGIYAEVLIAALIVNVLALVLPLFSIIVFDRLIPNFAENTFLLLSIGIAVLFAFDLILRLLRGHFVDSTARAVTARIADRAFERLLVSKLAAAREEEDVLTNIANDLEKVRTLLVERPVSAIVDLPFVGVFIFAIFAIGGPVALVPLVAVVAVLLLGLTMQFPLRTFVARATAGIRRQARAGNELVIALETLKSTVSEAGMFRRLLGEAEAVSGASRIVQGILGVMTSFTSSAGNYVTAGVMIYGAVLVSQGTLSIGGLVAISMLSAAAMSVLGRFIGILIDYQRAQDAIQAFGSIMKMPVERPEGGMYAAPKQIKGSIAFQNVFFRYTGQEAAALDGITLQIDAGEKVGIIGRMGSGKTTLARLAMGLYEPTEGVVAIDSTDIQNIDPALYRAHIGCLPQDVQIFEGSVRENIAIGDAQADDDTVHKVARIAGVDEFTSRHPMGNDMPVGIRGIALSTGQRQAIGIARALLRDPPILLLDEPTASLDNTSEGRFRARLGNTIGDKTLLLITNRASMLTLVDRLIVIDGGKIIADGAKQEVLDGLQGGHIQAMQGLD